jgi:hypothetical protein
MRGGAASDHRVGGNAGDTPAITGEESASSVVAALWAATPNGQTPETAHRAVLQGRDTSLFAPRVSRR